MHMRVRRTEPSSRVGLPRFDLFVISRDARDRSGLLTPLCVQDLAYAAMRFAILLTDLPDAVRAALAACIIAFARGIAPLTPLLG